MERQLADGTCPTLDARLRTHTLLEQEDTRLLLNASASGGILLKQAPRTRLVSTQADLLEALLEEIKRVQSRALQLDRVCFLELVLDYARKYDTLLAIEYARAVIKYRLAPRRLLLLPGLQTRMLSPADTVSRDVFDAARAAYAARTTRSGGSGYQAQPARTAPTARVATAAVERAAAAEQVAAAAAATAATIARR